jgi:ATP synthase protein I
MTGNEQEEDAFVSEVRRQADRLRAAKHMGFWQGLGLAGAVGWMVSLPAALGALLGHWLDTRFTTGIFWTLGLIALGLVVGCASAWRHVKQELKS